MRRALVAALVAVVSLSGCSLLIDPEGVKPPEEKQPPPPARGACVGTGAHRVCGGTVSSGAGNASAASGHAVEQSIVAGGAAPVVAGSQHRIVRGAVSP